ncbi:MAG: MFS transporter [Actinomycetota bacterium]
MAEPGDGALDGPRAWLQVAGAFSANFTTFGFLFSFGVFLTPIAETFGTTTAPVAAVFSAMVFVYYLSGALGGLVARRIGTRPVVAVGGALFSLALIGGARVSRLGLLHPFLALPVGMGIGGCYAPMIGAVGGWFERRRTQAIAVVLTGVGGGTMIMPTVSRALIDAVGWRQAMTVIGIAGIAVFVFAAAVSAPSPTANAGPAPLPFSAPIAEPLFRRMYASVVLMSPAFYAPLAFLNDYAVDRGVATGRAAALVGLIGGASVVARLFFGAVGDRVGAQRQYRLSYLLMTSAIAMWIVAGPNLGLMAGAAVLHGVGWAAWVTATPGVLSRAFGLRELGAVLGLFYTALGFGGLIGPWLTGALIDRSGFRAAIAFALVCAALATAVLATMPDDGGTSRA